MANQLEQQFSSSLPGGIDIRVVNDVNDPLEFRRVVEEIYNKLPDGWTDDVICDYLGMTAHASVGMVLACLDPPRPLEYTMPIFDPNRQVIDAADPMEVKLEWKHW